VFEEIAGAAIHQFHQGDPPAGGQCEFSGNVFRKPRKMTMRPAPDGRSPYYVEIIAWGEGSNRIHNNVFYGEGKRGGISLNSVNNRVAHNTFVGSAHAIQFHAGKPGNQVINNIVQAGARSVGPVPGANAFLLWPANALPQTLDHNLYYNATAAPRWQRDGVTHVTFGAYQQASGETHSRYQDPRLTGPADARPRPGSPAINAGITVKEFAADFDGITRPQGAAADIGAYEAPSPASRAAPARTR
jgi:hypothetical protein